MERSLFPLTARRVTQKGDLSLSLPTSDDLHVPKYSLKHSSNCRCLFLSPRRRENATKKYSGKLLPTKRFDLFLAPRKIASIH